MPESLKALRRRVRTINNTKQITRAMEMVAAAKLRRSQEALMAARPYSGGIASLLGRLAPLAEVTGHPLFGARRVHKSTLVIFTGDRGLCGSYNANIIRLTEKHLREHSRGRVELVCVGRRGRDYFSRRAASIAKSFTDFGGSLDQNLTMEITDFLCDRYLAHETDEVFLLYTQFISASVCKPRFEKYLDLDQSTLMRNVPKDDRGKNHDYIFEPSYQSVFEKMLPAYLQSKLYITLAESLTSEHSSRMLAMNSASKNCDELFETLTLRLNKARQSAITGDLLDIVGGAEALQQG